MGNLKPQRAHNKSGTLQKAVVQTVLEFFKPGEHFTIRDLVSLMEQAKTGSPNPLSDIFLNKNSNSQIGNILRIWNRNDLWLKEVRKMTGKRRLSIVDEGRRPLVYFWEGPGVVVVKPKPATVEAPATPGETVVPVPAPKPPKSPEIQILTPEVLFCEDKHMLIRLGDALWMATPFKWETTTGERG